MAIARTTTIEWNSKETCDAREQDYINNAPQEFPDASQLLFVRLNETTVMAVTLYPDEQTMQKADEARAKRPFCSCLICFLHSLLIRVKRHCHYCCLIETHKQKL